MPPDAPLCELCGHKWVVIGGGLCQICRTLDRLAAIVRSPEVPVSAECIVLQRLRACIGELQDLGELTRGVAPNPVQRPLVKAGGPPPIAPEPAAGSVGATSKAPPATPPPSTPEPVPEAPGAPTSHQSPPVEVKGDLENPPSLVTPASSSRPEKREKKKRSTKSPRSPRRSRKRSRRSRSGRSRDRARRSRLASPVRPEGVKAEESDSEERAQRRERKSRPLRPRSPSRPPRPRSPSRPPLRRAEPAPSRRPEGRHWVGPIPAQRREPPPGHGRHFGKNKGQTKRRKRADYQARRPRFWGRR